MSTPGFGLSATQQPSLTNLVEQKLRAERVVKTGAGWFLTIAILSLVNSVLSMSGTHGPQRREVGIHGGYGSLHC